MANNTGNPIGSIDLRDLQDNARNLDFLINGDADFYYDRFNKKRISIAGLTKKIEDLSLSVYINLKTYDELRSYEGNATTISILANVNNGFSGGNFWLDINDKTSLDNAGIIIVSNNGNRWKRLAFFNTVWLSWWEISDPITGSRALKNAVNSGASELIIDIDVDVNSEINLTNTNIKKIKVGPGVTIQRIGNGSIFVKNGTLIGLPIHLSNETILPLDNWLKVTGDDVSTINIDDWIYINSNCISPNVTSGSRTGMLRKVIAKSSNFLQLDMGLSQEIKGAGSSKGKIYRVNFGDKVIFEDGNYTSDSVITNKIPLIHFVLCKTPDLNNVKISRHGGAGASYMHCLGGSFNNSETSDLTDNSLNGNFGYGIHLGGATRDFCWNSGTASRCRHAITTGTAVLHTQTPENSWLPWGEPWFSDLNIYGVPESIYLGPVACRDCTNAAIDTHENAVNILITPNVNGGFDGINIRGWGVNVDGGQVIGTRRSNIRIFSAATNPVDSNWTGEIKIKGTLLKGMSLSGASEGGSIYSDQPGGTIYLEDVTIEETGAEGINITSPHTVLRAKNLSILKSGIKGSSPAIKNAGKNSKISGLLIKNFPVGIVDSGVNNEYLDVETENVSVLGTGNGRIINTLKTGNRGDAQAGRFLISGGRVSELTVPSSDNLMYVTPILVPNTCNINNFVINITSLGGVNVVTRFGIYADNGRGFPGSFICTGRLINPAVIGINKGTVTSGITTLYPGVYWVAVVQQGTGVLHTVNFTDESPVGIFNVGLTTPEAALSGIVGYSKIHLDGLSSSPFQGPVNEITMVPKLAIELA
ncbi:polysaccharide lyase tail spike protein [Aeromonas phage AerS_266]|nr:polysaccharide lyase tail spike protein [Aeromonas phage AerS_266]